MSELRFTKKEAEERKIDFIEYLNDAEIYKNNYVNSIKRTYFKWLDAQIFQRVSFGNSKITCLGMEAYGEKGKGCGYKFGVNVGLEVATYKLREVDSG